MLRAILYALLSILLITLVRIFAGWIAKAWREALLESKPPRRPAPASPLKKCQVCGSYAPVAHGVKVRGADAFVCSEACASKYAA